MGLNVSLNDDLARFVAAKVASGEYGSPNEVVEDALRLLEEAHKSDEEKLAWLRAAYDEGIASGDAGPLDMETVIIEARRRWGSGE
jgi:antitoxin ParD1/3/4